MSVPLILISRESSPRRAMKWESGTLMLKEEAFSHFPHIPPPRGARLTVLAPQPCAYLPGRETTLRATAARGSLDPKVYHDFMDAGFRRSGRMIYQPVCLGCRACVPIRVPVATFAPSKSQRRAVKRNADLSFSVGRPEPTQEKFELYQRYCARWHEREDRESSEGFVSFLYDSPVVTAEFVYRAGDRIVGVGICDVCEGRSLSSVYFYFEPAESGRSLGTFSAVREIDFAREAGLPYYYLGYWVRDCAAMNYKANFKPAETLGMDGVWRTPNDRTLNE